MTTSFIENTMDIAMDCEVDTSMNEDNGNNENNGVMNTQETKQKILFTFQLLNNNNQFMNSDFSIDGKLLWIYFMTLSRNLVDRKKFFGYFKKTMNTFIEFKNRRLNPSEKMDYFRRCLFLSNLQYVILLQNNIDLCKNSCIVKITPSKNNKKSCSLLDDSTISDENNNVIGETNGSENQPHRGYKLFFRLLPNQQQLFINEFYNIFVELIEIFTIMQVHEYTLFDPIKTIQEIVVYAKNNNLVSFMNVLSSEIYDMGHILSFDQQIELFSDENRLYQLWNSGFITDNQGKFRIFILCLYYILKVRGK
jgi:predicted DNA-binding protein YlxM (UPF0122 family)